MNVITCSNVPIFTAHHVAQYDACLYQAPANYTGAFFSFLPGGATLTGPTKSRVGRVRRSRHPAKGYGLVAINTARIGAG
ncbi:hypothetical protein C6A45_20745 [Enterobacter hormaechei]|nr:hypothetical protein AM451_03450 [Enterobacter cloacae complex sp.]RAY45689.1 hypothetical protein DP193_13485 [Enterobacter hormaechei subsp. oharae]RCA12895.1 hypothetical protein C6A45_20745 [Enterobacter hormaechei]RAY53487.1 hypothetical protein DP200_21735 [Enterobacter hormaechei subsp. oharae]TXV34200.1 hypothetical protein D4M74_10320 [Enterobacter hormaechei]